MKTSFKKCVLACFLIVSLILPMVVLPVAAATNLPTSVKGLTATWEYTAQSGGSAAWSSSGNTITGTATGGTVLTNTSKVVLTNGLGTEATLKFSYTNINGTLTLDGDNEDTCTFEKVLADGESVSFTYKSPRGGRTGTLTIEGISLISTTAADPTIVFSAPENGSYTVDGVAVNSATSKTVAAGTEITLEATAASGYQFYGWYDETSAVYLSQDATAIIVASSDAEIKPVFISDQIALFGVGTMKFDNLTEAGEVAASGSNKTIILLNSGTVSGKHTIPAGTTLLIPYDDKNTSYGSEASCTSYSSLINNSGHIAWVTPTAYRTLTMDASAEITVNGSIEVSGQHAAAGGALGMYGGSPTGPLGYINMMEGSHIELNSGANLYCWGYIYGNGTITAKNGANIYENFQIMDFRGGSVTSQLASEYFVFPLSQYYVQNIEVATTYEYGSAEYIATSIFMSNQCHSAAVRFIGDGAMFQPESGSCLVKDYNPSTDNLDLDVYGDCALSTMSLELGGTKVDSANFVLPITNNIQINIHSGTTTLKQNIMMLPGSSLTIDKEATLNLAYTDVTGDVVTAGGYVLQVFDKDNWTQGLNTETFEVVTSTNYVHPALQFRPVQYTATTKKTRTEADLKDVKIDINGKIIADGFLYSTVVWKDALNEDYSIAGGGANIMSSEKSGMIVMNNGAGQDMLGYMYDQSKATYLWIPLASAQLKNGDGSYLDTTNAEPGTTYQYCATHDCWYTGECEKCNATYTITWMNGSVSLGSAEVEAGTVPTYPGTANPTKADDATNHYIFKGWSTKDGGEAITPLPAVTGEATYYAVFDAEAHADSDKVALEGKHYCDKCSYLMYSCSDAAGDGNHECDYGCGRELTECSGGTATCKAQAKCTECGQSYGELAEHNYKAVVTAPTCSEGGFTTNTCSVCNESYVSDKVDALGHKYNGVVTAPTCTEPGYTTYTCSVCNDSYEADNVTATGHSYDNGVIVEEPTCNGEGSKKFTCGKCGDSYTEAVSAKGHINIVVVPGADPTCNDTGLTAGKKCLDCGEFTEAQTEIPALGHDYKSVVTAPTCTEEGYTTYTCSRCGDSYKADEVDAKGHDYKVTYRWEKVSDSDWKCIATATCACSDVQTESINATATVTKNATCTEDGIKVLRASFNAEWAAPQEKEEVILAIGHDYKSVVTAPTCTADGYTTYTCANCSDSYTDDEVKSEGHKYDAVVTAPTCTAGGYTTYTCSVCSDSYVDDAVPALGHGKVEGLTYTDLKDGNHSVTCNDCDTVTVTSEAHSYDEDTHICECKAVETFELTIEYIVVYDDNTWNHEEKTIKVPYGANIYDELAKESDFHKEGEKVFVNDPYGYKGEIEIHGWLDSDAWVNLDENSTMPAKNLHIYQEHGNYGWEYFEGLGLAYYDGASYLEGWNYIKEDYDGVDGGAWYYFEMKESAAGDSIGIRAEGITRALYPTEEIDGVKYEADKETLDYCESKGEIFIDAESGLFLFGEDGKFLNDFTGIKEYKDADRYVENGFMKWHPGVVNVDGEYYYFIGDEAAGGNAPANGDTYIIRDNGVDGFKKNDIYNFENGKLSGADGIVDGKYYNASKLMTGNGLTELDDKYIYVRSNGEVVANHKYWIGDNEFGIVPGFYDFDADGYMIDIKTTDKEGIFFEDGAYYYYENGVLAYMGLINYTGKADNGTVYENDWIYVRSNGQLATGEYWTTKNNSELKTQTYIFDEFGKMVRIDGIIEENGNLYYYVSGIKQKGLGLIELEGKYYYVRTAGELVRNREYWITNVNETGVIAQSYFFDNNGVMQNVVFSKSETVNGVVDGYYYENGKIVYGAGLVELDDGSIIYVRSNGQLATGVYWPTTLNGVLPAGKYDFGADGRLVTQ